MITKKSMHGARQRVIAASGHVPCQWLDLGISNPVLSEAAAGDSKASERRLVALDGSERSRSVPRADAAGLVSAKVGRVPRSCTHRDVRHRGVRERGSRPKHAELVVVVSVARADSTNIRVADTAAVVGGITVIDQRTAARGRVYIAR